MIVPIPTTFPSCAAPNEVREPAARAPYDNAGSTEVLARRRRRYGRIVVQSWTDRAARRSEAQRGASSCAPARCSWRARLRLSSRAWRLRSVTPGRTCACLARTSASDVHVRLEAFVPVARSTRVARSVGGRRRAAHWRGASTLARPAATLGSATPAFGRGRLCVAGLGAWAGRASAAVRGVERFDATGASKEPPGWPTDDGGWSSAIGVPCPLARSSRTPESWGGASWLVRRR